MSQARPSPPDISNETREAIQHLSAVGLANYDGIRFKNMDADNGLTDFSWEFLFRGYSKLLFLAFEKMDRSDIENVTKSLDFEGRFCEPSLERNAPDSLLSHVTLSKLDNEGNADYLLELLLTQHDIEFFIRPNLLRMAWIMNLACGEDRKYESYQVRNSGIVTTITDAINKINSWLDQKSSMVLSPQEIRSFRHLLSSMSCPGYPSLTPDNLRNWIAHRDFILTDEAAILNYHPAPGLRINVPKKDVVMLRVWVLQLSILLIALNGMFASMIHGITGRTPWGSIFMLEGSEKN